MEGKINNLSSQHFKEFYEDVLNSKKSGTYVKINNQKSLPINPWVVALSLVFTWVLISAYRWSSFYYFICIGPLIVYLLADQFQSIFRWYRLGKDAIWFGPMYFVSMVGKKFQKFPLTQFESTDITMESGGRAYIARFFFEGSCIILPCPSKSDIHFQRFQENIQRYCSALKFRGIEQVPAQKFKTTFLVQVMPHRGPIMYSIFSFILLIFLVPMLIDNNQYKLANQINTATSYRQYLSESRNIRHREIAQKDIRALYDQAIKAYKSKSSGTAGTVAFTQLIEYLRDHNLYTVHMEFHPQSELIDGTFNTKYKIVPVATSFSQGKNQERQDHVIDVVKASLGSVFPTDILSINSEDTASLPKLDVFYIYKNDPESVYYFVEEEKLPIEKRTWYYGIMVYWRLTLSLPTQTGPIYSFQIVSKPAQQFNTESSNTDAVYTNMALSSFQDFKNEFFRQFLNWSSP
jgi:hypothetical protein